VSWAPLVFISLVFKPDVFVPVTIIEGVTLFIVMNVVTPRVMGNAVGINPVLVLAAVFIGAQVAGAFGAIFGVPVLAVIVSLLDTYIDRIRPPDAEEQRLAESDSTGTPASETAAEVAPV
jgi:predicted PurR-regulated permease PerM